MRILTVGDTHQGITSGYRVTLEGVNQRDQDFRDAFDRVIGAAEQYKPDLVLHTGDLFNGIRPTNATIKFVIDRIQALAHHTKTIIIISGNHEKPRMDTVTHIFDVVGSYFSGQDIHFVTDELADIVIEGGLVVHAIPYMFDPADVAVALRKVTAYKSGMRYNRILLMHGSLVEDFMAPDAIPDDEFQEAASKMSLSILGHNHNPRYDANKRILVAGAVERDGFDENTDRYLWLHEINENFPMSVIPLPLPVRPMHDFSISGTNKTAAEITDEVRSLPNCAQEIVRLTINNVKPAIYPAIDRKAIKMHFNDATTFQLRVKRISETAQSDIKVSYKAVDMEWTSFATGLGIPKQIIDRGCRMIQQFMPQSDGGIV